MVRAKFKVTGKSPCGADAITINMWPVYSDDPDSENKKFWDYTPSGQITLTTTNINASEYFVTNKEYYVDFVEANDNI